MRPELQIKHQRLFTNRADYGTFSLIRVSNFHLKNLGGRNAWVALKAGNGKCVYRMIRGAGNQPHPDTAIELDYDTSVDLEIPQSYKEPNGFYACALTLRPASRIEMVRAHWSHPDPAYRVPMQISLVGFFLGVVGLVLGVLSLK